MKATRAFIISSPLLAACVSSIGNIATLVAITTRPINLNVVRIVNSPVLINNYVPIAA
jgi:hypothetical protein